jgi:hypothetical protein
LHLRIRGVLLSGGVVAALAVVAGQDQGMSSIDKVAFRSGGGLTLTATSHDFPGERFRDPRATTSATTPPLVVGR